MLSLLELCQHLPSSSFGQAIPAQLPQDGAVSMALGVPSCPWSPRSPDLGNIFTVPDLALVLD